MLHKRRWALVGLLKGSSLLCWCLHCTAALSCSHPSPCPFWEACFGLPAFIIQSVMLELSNRQSHCSLAKWLRPWLTCASVCPAVPQTVTLEPGNREYLCRLAKQWSDLTYEEGATVEQIQEVNTKAMEYAERVIAMAPRVSREAARGEGQFGEAGGSNVHNSSGAAAAVVLCSELGRS